MTCSLFFCVFCLLVFSFMWKIRWEIEHLSQLLIDPHLCNTEGEERYLFKIVVVWNTWGMSRTAETLALLINGDAGPEQCAGSSILKTEVILSKPTCIWDNWICTMNSMTKSISVYYGPWHLRVIQWVKITGLRLYIWFWLHSHWAVLVWASLFS